MCGKVLEGRLQLEYWLQFWAYKTSKLESVQRGSPRCGAGALALAGRLRELALVSTEVGLFWGILPAAPSIPMGSHLENRAGICIVGQRENKREEAQGFKEKVLLQKGSQTSEQIAQRGCTVSILGGLQSPNG